MWLCLWNERYGRNIPKTEAVEEALSLKADIRYWRKKFPGVDPTGTKTSNLEEIHRNDWVDNLGWDDFHSLMFAMNPCGILTDVSGRRIQPKGRWKVQIRGKRCS